MRPMPSDPVRNVPGNFEGERLPLLVTKGPKTDCIDAIWEKQKRTNKKMSVSS